VGPKEPAAGDQEEVPPLPHRRGVLGACEPASSRPASARLASAAPLPSVANPQDQTAFPWRDDVLAGRRDGLMARWCQTTRPTLAQSPAPGRPVRQAPVRQAPVRQANVGGADRVTGANEFDVKTTPDGRTASAFAGPGVIRVAAATPAGP